MDTPLKFMGMSKVSTGAKCSRVLKSLKEVGILTISLEMANAEISIKSQKR